MADESRAQVMFGCAKSRRDNYTHAQTIRSIAEKTAAENINYIYTHNQTAQKNYTQQSGHKAPGSVIEKDYAQHSGHKAPGSVIDKYKRKQIYRQKYTYGSAVKHTPRAVY